MRRMLITARWVVPPSSNGEKMNKPLRRSSPVGEVERKRWRAASGGVPGGQSPSERHRIMTEENSLAHHVRTGDWWNRSRRLPACAGCFRTGWDRKELLRLTPNRHALQNRSCAGRTVALAETGRVDVPPRPKPAARVLTGHVVRVRGVQV